MPYFNGKITYSTFSDLKKIGLKNVDYTQMTDVELVSVSKDANADYLGNMSIASQLKNLGSIISIIGATPEGLVGKAAAAAIQIVTGVLPGMLHSDDWYEYEQAAGEDLYALQEIQRVLQDRADTFPFILGKLPLDAPAADFNGFPGDSEISGDLYVNGQRRDYVSLG